MDYYQAGNGEHPDWDDYRATMVADKRLLVVLSARARLRDGRAGLTPGGADSPAQSAQAGVSTGADAAAGADPPLSDSSTSWERSSTRTSSCLS